MPPTITTDLGFFDPVTLTGDSHVVGTVSPGAPASPAAVADYINFMILMGTNTSDTHDFGGAEGIQTLYRTTNTGFGPNGYGLSGWILFGPTGTVPDGGTTVMLLGTALGALGMARRFLRI